MSKFHLGWFLGPGITIQGWNEPGFGHGYDWTKPDLFVDAAKALERACFDLLILEDTSAVPYTYKGSMDFYLKHAAMTPKFDPVMLTPYLIAATSKIGLAPTLTTTFYPPWLLARSMSTLDHYSNGRIGWNIVTATSDAAAQNYGLDKQIEHDLRYDMADEFIDCVTQLWDAWEPDAVVMDEATGTFIDPTKVKAVHFEGKYYKTRGPLNVPRSPRASRSSSRPAARRADANSAAATLKSCSPAAPTPADMKDYREEVLRNAVAYGRDPETVKTLFTCVPTIVQSKSDVEPMKEMMQKGKEKRMEHGLAAMSFLSGIDFSKFNVDEPVGEIKTNGMQTMLKSFGNPNDSLRQIMNRPNEFSTMVGTADSIAGLMQDTMEEVGGDGFLIAAHFKPKYVTSIVDELVPALQKRQLTRTEYGYDHFRDNLMAF